MQGYATNDVSDVRIIGNTCVANTRYGINIPFITILSAFGVHLVTILGNVSRSNGWGGGLVQSSDTTISGNVFSLNGSGSATPGLACNGEKLSVTGNTMQGNYGIGLDLGACADVVATGNLVGDNGATGINVEATVRALVSGNLVYNNCSAYAGAGIGVVGGTDTYPQTTADVSVIENRVGTPSGNQLHGILVLNYIGPEPNVGGYTINNVVLMSNDCRGSGITADVSIQSGVSNVHSENNTSKITFNSGIAASSSISISSQAKVVFIFGSTTIDSIVADDGTFTFGHEITLFFNGSVDVSTAGNIVPKGGVTFNAVSGALLKLFWDGSVWREASRNV